jgi:3-methyladenine DNA glycosylase/8-oxoguanine DNA glycosylase
MAFLPVPGPFDFARTTARFRVFGLDRATPWYEAGGAGCVDDSPTAAGGIPGVHRGALYRVAGGRQVRIVAAVGGVEVDPLDAGSEPVVRWLLGLDFDLDGFYAWAARDATLAPLVARFAGLRPTLAPDPFEALVTSIAAQQVSLRSALAIRNRLIERFGERVGLAWAFPTRTRLAAATEEELVAVGFSRRKAECVVALARSDLDLDVLATLPDDEVKARIVAHRGLGEWTADWFLARHLARPRAWPAGDLALRKVVEAVYGESDMRAAGVRFDPFQNLTAHYLLATYPIQ